MRHQCEYPTRENGCGVQKLLQGLTALLGLALSGLSFAQSSGQPATGADAETWYQIEVIVFARPDSEAGEEVWPRNLFLSYPFNWTLLRDPEQPVLRQPAPETPTSATQNDPLALRIEEQPELVKPDLSRDPMLELPASERQLNGHAHALERRNGHQVLFHEAWRQPMVEDRELAALVITGGEKFGDHFELEGSIRLSLSRYLHLNTDLWLTRFEPNYGQELGAWPQLPNRPSLEKLEPETQSVSTELPSLDQGATGAWQRALKADQNSAEGLDQASELPSFLRQPYLPNRIVTLKQSRRMRSTELHYLDHPLMGLLIVVTPYQRPLAEPIPELELGR